MIEGSEKPNRKLGFELQSLHMLLKGAVIKFWLIQYYNAY